MTHLGYSSWPADPRADDISRPGQPEEAVLQEVAGRVLTPDFVAALVAKVNTLLAQEEPTLGVRIGELRRRLDELDTAINVLLDLAEKFGATSAAQRLLEREAERNQVQAELEYLEAQRDRRRREIPPEVIQSTLAEMTATLDGSDVKAKRALLKKIVAWVKLGKEGGKVAYTFPLRDVCADLYQAPPGECFIKVRTIAYADPESLDH